VIESRSYQCFGSQRAGHQSTRQRVEDDPGQENHRLQHFRRDLAESVRSVTINSQSRASGICEDSLLYCACTRFAWADSQRVAHSCPYKHWGRCINLQDVSRPRHNVGGLCSTKHQRILRYLVSHDHENDVKQPVTFLSEWTLLHAADLSRSWDRINQV